MGRRPRGTRGLGQAVNRDRAQLVARTLGGVLTGEARRAVGLRPASTGAEGLDRQQQRARAIRQAFEDLGPLYVKVGQMLSTRPDICPQYLMDEFEHLHAKVVGRPLRRVRTRPGRRTGRELEALLPRHRHRPDRLRLDGAGLQGQLLKSGKPAVVKIQRPGVQKSMLEDMALLPSVVRRLAKRMPDLNDVLDLEAMLDVIFTSMRPELDFTLEGENMDDFRDRVEDFETLAIPEVSSPPTGAGAGPGPGQVDPRRGQVRSSRQRAARGDRPRPADLHVLGLLRRPEVPRRPAPGQRVHLARGSGQRSSTGAWSAGST